MQFQQTPELLILSAIPEALATLIARQGTCEVQAVLIGNEIRLKELIGHSVARKEPLLCQLSDKSIAIIYAYGALVFFNATTAETVELITQCQRFTSQLFSIPETEHFTVLIQPNQPEGIVQTHVSLKCISKERLELIGDALAKSVVLEYHENRIGSLFEKSEPIAQSLKERGKLGYRANDLLKHIGASLMMAQEMVGRIEIQEKPQLLWEHPELDPLHTQLIEDLEILERHDNLERKIDLISHTAQTSLGVLQQRHACRLEWYIIILISIEIILQCYELFVRPLMR